MEKLLLEACLEMMAIPGLVVGIQDMGAAGLTCSTCETASRGNSGIEIDLDLVPQRETGMNSYEIMLSESQERMLVIVQKGREREIEEVFEKWDLHAAHVGEVKDGIEWLLNTREWWLPIYLQNHSRMKHQFYDQPASEPAHVAARDWRVDSIPELSPDSVESSLLKLLAHQPLPRRGGFGNSMTIWLCLVVLLSLEAMRAWCI